MTLMEETGDDTHNDGVTGDITHDDLATVIQVISLMEETGDDTHGGDR